MTIPFHKYQGTGNDFVMIDNRTSFFPKENVKLVAQLCDRRFGIGADGLILLENHPDLDFKMVYYNADGRLSSMCGNGGRCIVAFAKALSLVSDSTTFEAVDGLHEATIIDGFVALKMTDVTQIKKGDNYTFLDTGSPHHVQSTTDVSKVNVKEEGARIRYSEMYGDAGSNINFVQKLEDDTFAVRTYERGVEDETLSCGTGVTAVAIAMHATGVTTSNQITIKAQGGELEVSFSKHSDGYADIWLKGSATYVFKGEWIC